MTIRIPPRREWFGDLEPEYQEIWHWKCHDTLDGGQDANDGLPLSWRAMIASTRSARSTLGLGA
ncbi:MAG: hypothetical protein HQL91_04775 [Magnetococcales bacterium]|nr:hypothetical protein [Magnetococcales bacterium]